MRRFKISLAMLAICLMFVSLLPVNVLAADAVESTLTLATTTSTQDSGLLDVLVPAFEKEYNTKVKVIAVGSGAAMELGQKGDADVLLVHSRAAEDKFIADGYGINRKDVMHNEFLVVGPASDPAKIKGMTDVTAAFKKIAEAKSKFVSRGDKSGTNTKELGIWKKTGLKTALPWYIEAGKGMGDTILMAGEMNAYTLVDEATWMTWKSKTELKDMVQGDKILFNPYGVIQVNPAKYPTIHKNAAKAFSDFITGAKGQAMIASFGKEKYGKALFTPDAITAPVISEKASVLTIGSNKYKIMGSEQSGDLAPYIKNSRTFMPIRPVAYALGIADSNIAWDGSSQQVTLTKGDTVVKLTINKKIMSVNGKSVTIDTAPEITGARACLPVAQVVQAFGSTITWDAAARTVIIQ
ncbi:MAG: substrate-binding domain-containing protein [Syntrophomonadaceae bacterium]|nr:substrate-binding domain-containing protein [Syntrophomonadaceae bacterium]